MSIAQFFLPVTEKIVAVHGQGSVAYFFLALCFK